MQSEAGKKITASSVFPQVSADLDVSTAKTGGKSTDSYSYGISGTQLIFDGAKTANDIKAASENIKVTRFNYKFTSSEVRLRLRTAYVNLLKAQELLNLTDEIYSIRRGNLELITLRYESGLEHKGALLTAEANLAAASFEITQAMRGVQVAQRQLAKEMGRKQSAPVKVTGDFQVSNPEKARPDFETLVATNPSLLALLTKINQAGYTLKSAYDSFYPQLSAQAGASRSDIRWPPGKERWDLGLSLSVPIFEGGLRWAQVSSAESVLGQAKANERSGRDALVLALERTWAALQDTIDFVGVQEKFLTAAKTRSKIAEAQYANGFISYDNWAIIEDDFCGAKKSFLDAQANALLAEANWVQAKGETLEHAQ